VKCRHWPQLIINRASLTAAGSFASERKRNPWKSSSVKNSVALLFVRFKFVHAVFALKFENYSEVKA